MRRLALLLVLVGCGRVGFGTSPLITDDAATDGPVTDGPPAGNDEDGDGVSDGSDTCPHLIGAQTDGDGDGVGDLCDPNPTTPGDAIALFATMGPGDQPFITGGGDFDSVFTQKPDKLRFDGPLGSDGNLYGNLQFPIVLGSARVALGIELLEVIPGSASGQNQIALAVYDQPPNYFVEVSQIDGLFDNAAVVFYDGSNFSAADARDLETGMHPGPLFMQTTQRVGQGVRLDAGWPGEPYVAEVQDNLYQGAARIELNVNNVHFDIQWLVVITSP
jgi:hypothetical protein